MRKFGENCKETVQIVYPSGRIQTESCLSCKNCSDCLPGRTQTGYLSSGKHSWMAGLLNGKPRQPTVLDTSLALGKNCSALNCSGPEKTAGWERKRSDSGTMLIGN